MSPRGRVLSGAWIGVLTRFVPPGLVDEALAEARAADQRLRAVPGRLVVYFVLALCLYSHLSYGQVMREITGGLERRLAAAGWRVPATTTLTAARRRAGPAPLEALFRRLCSPLTPAAPHAWSHVCGLLAAAWDGTTVATAASEANIAAFGQVKGSHGGHFTHQRLVTLIACGTRGLIDAAIGPARGKGTGEPALARQLLRSLHKGMLLLADRNFYSYQLWNAAAATHADLLWRVKASLRLQPVQLLDDGSFLARINDPRAVQRRLAKNGTRRRRHSTLPPDTSPLPGITVRVIQFTLTITTTAGATRSQPVRLITTLTDTHAYPAAELAAAYARRWAIETSYRELKTYLRGPGRILRAKTPDLARQELWACLITYQALRTLICHTAATKDLDPARISFTTTLHAARRTLNTPRTRPRTTLTQVQNEILTTLVPARPGRTAPRATCHRTPAFPSPRTCKGPRTQHATCTTTITPPTTTNQPQHPAPQPATPP